MPLRTDPWEHGNEMSRLLARVKKLDIGDAVRKIIEDAEHAIEAIRRSPEFKVADKTGNVYIYADEFTGIRERAMKAVAKLAADTESEIEYLGPVIAEDREAGSFARQVGEEGAARGWGRASALLSSGIDAGSVVELAAADGDREQLAGLERYAPTWLRASVGDRFNESGVRRTIAAVEAKIAAATDPMMSSSGAAYREAAREFAERETKARAWIDFGHKGAAGRATAGDHIALAYEIGDVPTRAAERPDNHVRGDASGILESLPGRVGIGTTIL